MNSSTEAKRQALILAYARMMVYSIATVVFAVLCAYLFNHFYPLSNIWVLLLESAGYVCWGTSLGALGMKINSSNRENSPDVLNRNLNFVVSMLGIFVFSLAQFLHALA